MTNCAENKPESGGLATAESKCAAYERQRSQLFLRNKAALFEALVAAGVTTIIVKFDGYGDSGQLEGIETKAGDVAIAMPDRAVDALDALWDGVEPRQIKLTIADMVERLVFDCLAEKYSGWEDSEGSYGDVVFDVTERTITLDYNERFVESTYSQHVF